MFPLALAAALTAGAWTPEACPFGVNAHQADTDALQQAADAGVKWVRFDMNWHQFEPSKGVYDWTVADRFMADAAANDLEVFVTVAYGPAWAGPVGCDDAHADEAMWCRNAVPAQADWTDFVTAAVDRYGSQVKAWGMWNEPNLFHFWQGTRDQYVDTILIPGSDAVHAACSDCKVLGPELAHLRSADWDSDAGTCLFDECIFNGWEVSLREILIDAGPWIDVISHHKYTDPADTFWSEAIDGESLLSVQFMHGIKELTDDHAPGKPVWITEMGWETSPGGPHDPVYAGDQLYEAYAILPEVQQGTWSGTAAGAWPELERMFWYDLTDDPVVHPWGQYTWGLLDAYGQPKETWTAYADVVADLGGCADVEGTTTDPGTGGSTGTTTGGTDGTETTPPGGTDETGRSGVDTAGQDAAVGAQAPSGCGCTHTGGGFPLALLPGVLLLCWRSRRGVR